MGKLIFSQFFKKQEKAITFENVGKFEAKKVYHHKLLNQIK